MMTLSPFFDLSSDFAFLIFEMAWKSAIILGSVVLLNKFLKRQSASLRRSILSTAIFATLAFMAIAPAFPRWNVFLPNWLWASSFAKSANVMPAGESANRDYQVTKINSGIKTGSTFDNQSQPNLENQATKIDFITFAESAVSFIWLTVTFILLRRLWKSLFGLKYLRRSSGFQINKDLNSLVEDVSKKFGCGAQNITVLKNEAVTIPITWGILRHIILLPKDFDELPVEYRRAILTHELNHIERYDFITRVLTEILCAVLWFQPLVWLVRRQLREEQERAADDRVLATGEKPSAYAKLLLEWNERLSVNNQTPVAARMIERSSLKLRINAILNPNLERRSMARLEITLVWLATLGLAIPLTGLAFSSEMLPDEQISVESANQPESLYRISNENSANNIERPLQNSDLSKGTEKVDKRQIPTRTTFATTVRSDELNLAGEVKPKNKSNEFKNPSGDSKTNTNQALSPIKTNSADAPKTLLPEKDKKDSTSASDQATGGKTHQAVRQVFENIRQGFKNGEKPINIFDP